jgi:hypothetical protein
MLAASFIAIFFIPALFYMIERLGGAEREQARAPFTGPAPAPQTGD